MHHTLTGDEVSNLFARASVCIQRPIPGSGRTLAACASAAHPSHKAEDCDDGRMHGPPPHGQHDRWMVVLTPQARLPIRDSTGWRPSILVLRRSRRHRSSPLVHVRPNGANLTPLFRAEVSDHHDADDVLGAPCPCERPSLARGRRPHIASGARHPANPRRHPRQ